MNKVLIIKKKTRLSLLSLVLSVLVLICLNLPILTYYTKISDTFLYISFLVMLFFSIEYILIYKMKIEIFNYITLFYCLIILSTYYNGTNLKIAIKTLIYSFTLCLIFIYGIRVKGNSFLNLICRVLQLLVIADLLSELIYPMGLYATELYSENWILGYKTAHANIALPTLVFASLISVNKKNKIDFCVYLFSAISIFDSLLSQATAGTFILILYTILLLLMGSNNINVEKILLKLLNAKIILIIWICINIFLVFIQNIRIFSFLIVGVFQKSLTLSSRTIIWNACIKLFNERPLIGKGIISSYEYVNLTNIAGGTQPHNFLLGILVAGGILGLMIYFAIFFKAFASIQKLNKKDRCICGYAIIVNMILGLSSYNVFTPFTFVLYLIPHCLSKKLINK